MEYEKDLRIDEEALDLEWLDQPSLMMKYTRLQARLQKEEDEVKERLELVTADLDKDIRENPDNYGLGDIPKITEAVVKGAVLNSKKYKDANAEYLEARFENNIAKGAVRSVDQRKTSLENLVKLHGQQYFAGPRVPRDITEERQMRQKRADETVGRRTKRKTK